MKLGSSGKIVAHDIKGVDVAASVRADVEAVLVWNKVDAAMLLLLPRVLILAVVADGDNSCRGRNARVVRVCDACELLERAGVGTAIVAGIPFVVARLTRRM